MQKLYVDIDNTICKTQGTDYAGAEPFKERIAYLNELYDSGEYQINYWTARGRESNQPFRELTEKQLQEWGVKYHSLFMRKPYDYVIDDKAFNMVEAFSEHID